MIIKYIIFSISITFISFIVGMITSVLFKNTRFYQEKLANLNFIESDKLNTIIGVNVVKWIVKNTFFKFLNPYLKLDRNTTIQDLKITRQLMTKAEIDHIFAFIFVSFFILFQVYKQEFVFALVILVVNIIMNLCPSLLQQQNKRRIDRLILRFSKSNDKSQAL